MEHHRPDIDRLIGLYLSRQASKSEEEELEEWLNISKDNRETFYKLQKVWSMTFPDEYSIRMDSTRDQIWETGMKQENARRETLRRETLIYRWSKIAAVIALVLLGGWLFTQSVDEGNHLLPEPIAWVTKENPAGQRSVHTLSDGTKVWLNVGSKLVFPKEFSDTLRRVQLVGEAFFEVVSDEKKPFIVEAGTINTEVLGTAFNVQAYPEDREVKVALLAGKVQIKSANQAHATVLVPGEEVIVGRSNAEFIKQPFDYASSFGWKEGILVFDGVDFNSFRSTIEKWYGIKIEVNGQVPNDWSIRARYQRESLQNVLKDISFNKNIEFQFKEKKVYITF